MAEQSLAHLYTTKADKEHTHDGTEITSAVSNATNATKLEVPRTILLTGDVTGSATFDGSSDITINAAINSTSAGSCGNSTHGFQMFTSSGTFTVPDGVTTLKVTCVGGAGGGGGGFAKSNSSYGAAGGTGATGYSNTKLLAVVSGTTYSVTIGNGGNGGACGGGSYGSGTSGTAGGTTSFGTLLSVPGGPGGGAGTLDSTLVTYNGTAAVSYSYTHGIFYDYSVGGVSANRSSGTAGTSGLVLVEW